MGGKTTMGTIGILTLIYVGVCAWVLLSNDSQGTSEVKSFVAGIAQLKALEAKVVTEKQFVDIIAPIRNSLKAVQDSVAGSNVCVEEVFKRIDLMESKQVAFEKRFDSEKRTFSVRFKNPVPVTNVTPPPPPPGKAKATK